MLSTKKPASAKRAPLPRKSDHSRQFEKDWEKLTHSGKQDMQRLKEVMTLLISNAGPLPAEWLDHELDGDWAGHRECHAKGDLLLIYRLQPGLVLFARAGTHAELFGR